MLNYYRSDGWVKTTQGPAVPGAQIYVCTQPANVTPPVTPARTTPVPWQGPNPQALIYSDAGLTPIVQPIITDGFGHYDFYVLPGLYTVVVMFNGQVQQVYVDQSIGNVGSTSGSAVLFSTNGTPNFNQLVQNLVQGAGITIVTDNFGNTVFTASGGGSGPVLKTNGTSNSDQAILNMISGSSITLAADGAGGVTISTVAPTIPSIKRWAYWEINAGGTFPFNVVNDQPVEADSGATSNFVAPSATAGPTFTIALANQVRNYYGQQFIFPNRAIYWEGTANMTFDVPGAASKFYTGLSDDVVSGTNPDASSNFIGFYVLKTNGSGNFGNFFLLVGNGVSYSYVDTGVAIAVNTRYKLSFTFDGTTVKGFVNGTQVATCTTNIPASPLALYWRLQGLGFAGTTTDVMEYMYAEVATP